ncbi:MAG: class III extradiol dioxygenase subunit B-like domain-containing protein [Patescibacteria group bacterium]|nr:class III extradiol dioxygenase subunit B-like domain-containing protein [Patescibacteria group bacterium]
MIIFACFSPHPPLLLPNIGPDKDKTRIKNTIKSLQLLGKKFKELDIDALIISSPHLDWGFNVPLFFIAPNFSKEIKKYLIKSETPQSYFKEGKNIYSQLKPNKKYALIASGDMSHCLKKEGPYGFHPNGPKYDKALIKFLKTKETEKFLELDKMFPRAEECGLRSFSFILGILEASKINWQPEILSYENPFGVGYLTVNIKLN